SRGTAAAIDVTACGQTIPDYETGVLTTDLVCSTGSTAVTLGYASKFEMNGHTIDVPDGWGVWCVSGSRCTVTGGGSGGALGEIKNGNSGIYIQRGVRLIASG